MVPIIPNAVLKGRLDCSSANLMGVRRERGIIYMVLSSGRKFARSFHRRVIASGVKIASSSFDILTLSTVRTGVRELTSAPLVLPSPFPNLPASEYTKDMHACGGPDQSGPLVIVYVSARHFTDYTCVFKSDRLLMEKRQMNAMVR